jgi:hypothetical protein
VDLSRRDIDEEEEVVRDQPLERQDLHGCDGHGRVDDDGHPRDKSQAPCEIDREAQHCNGDRFTEMDGVLLPRLNRFALTLTRSRAEMDDLVQATCAILALVYVEGMTYREAAEAESIPLGTVMSRLARARLVLLLEANGTVD